MCFTLHETLSQMDLFVHLSNGTTVQTVGYWLQLIDPDDATEYVLTVDDAGRFLIHRLDSDGQLVRPPEFVEAKEKSHHPAGFPRQFFYSEATQLYA